MNLSEKLEEVQDEASFLAFVRELAEDRKAASAVEHRDTAPFDSGPGAWENRSIESFLEAALAWAEDSRFGATQGLESADPWRKFAAFLYCGKVYE